MTRRRLLIAAGALAVLFVWLVVPAGAEYRGTDVLGGLVPGRLGGIADRYPLSAYSLDSYVDSGTLGTNTSTWGPQAAHTFAGWLWMVTLFFTNLVISVLAWAFSLGLLQAAIGPIAAAIKALHQNVFGDWAMAAMITVTGLWGTYKLAQRRHNEMYAGLGMTILLSVLALFFVLQPTQTVRMFTNITDPLTMQLLSGGSGKGASAKQKMTDRLFASQVVTPWVLLNFGSYPRHCVDQNHPVNGWPKPVKSDDPNRTLCRSIMHRNAGGHGNYAERFLKQPVGSDERKHEYEALAAGNLDDFGDDDQFNGYAVDRSDAPVVDIQQQGGADQRLILALAVAFAGGCFVILMGALAFGVILAQVLALAMLCLSPLMLLAAFVPGPGHQLFKSWSLTTIGWILRKLVYALVILILITIGSAIVQAVPGAAGYFLIGVLYFMLIVKHKDITAKITGGATTTAVPAMAPAMAQAATAKTVATGGVAAAAATVGSVVTRRNESLLRKEEESSKHTETESKKDRDGLPPDSSSPPASVGREPTSAGNGTVDTVPAVPVADRTTTSHPVPAIAAEQRHAASEPQAEPHRPAPGRNQNGNLRNFEAMRDSKLERTADRLTGTSDAEAQDAVLHELYRRHPNVDKVAVRAKARNLTAPENQPPPPPVPKDD